MKKKYERVKIEIISIEYEAWLYDTYGIEM